MVAEEQQQSGEIFSGDGQQSAYAQAAQALSEEQPVQESPVAEQSQQSPPPNGAPAPDGDFVPPPVFTEHPFRKYFILGAIVLFLIIIIFFIYKFVSGLFHKSTPTSSPQQSVTLTYWGLWEEKSVMDQVINEYKKTHPQITIQYSMQDPKQYRERLQAAIDRGEGPDIFRFHNTWVPMMKDYVSIMPTTIYSDSEYAKTFYPVAVTDMKVANGFVGIPLEIDGLVLFYNEDMLKAANVDVPKTWLQVQESIEKLTVKQDKKIITSAIAMGLAENVENFSDILSLMMLQNGTKMSTSLTSCTDTTSTTCASEALAFYHAFAEDPNATWDETFDTSTLSFAGGKAAMLIAPSWQANTILAINPTLSFKAAPVPQLPCDTQPCPQVDYATYWVEGVNPKSKQSAAAWEFLKYLSSGEVMQKMYAQQVFVRKTFGEPYARVDLAGLLKDNPYIGPVISSAPTMKSFYAASRTQDGESGIDAKIISYMKDAVNSLNTGASPETAVDTLDKGIKQVYAQYGITASP